MIDSWLFDDESAGAAGSGESEDQAGQYLCFWLGPQTYALPVSEVQEIRAKGNCSVLPGGPAWVLGAMNLRGLVIPVLDLRLRFGLAPPEVVTTAPVLIVVSAGGKLAGLVVDGVMDVIGIAGSALRPAGTGESAEARCVSALASLSDSVVVVLNAAALMSWDQTAAGGLMQEEGAGNVAMVL